MAIDRSDVCVIMTDATEGFTEQDSAGAALAHEAEAVAVMGKQMGRRKRTQIHAVNTGKSWRWISLWPTCRWSFISAKTG